MSAVEANDPPYVYPARKEWLGRVSEAPLDPEVPVVDAHHHFSDRRQYLYMLHELMEDVGSGHRVLATVFLEGRMCECGTDEATRGVAETGVAMALGALAEARGQHGIAAAIVGIAELSQGTKVGEVLRAHIAAGAGRFRGVRQIAPWDPSPVLSPPGLNIDPELLSNKTFREGFGQLAPLNLSFDAWLYYPQYDRLRALGEAFPNTQIILNFPIPLGAGGYALGSASDAERWKAAVRSVAQCPNIAVKLGGFGMGIAGLRFGERPNPPTSTQLAAAMKPYFEVTVEAFGADRCLIGSNFPVDKGSFSYTVFWNACKLLLRSLPIEQRSAILSENALRYYRVDVQH
jgi:predicted TIM-barrel fold metal-dependent hydrolase